MQAETSRIGLDCRDDEEFLDLGRELGRLEMEVRAFRPSMCLEAEAALARASALGRADLLGRALCLQARLAALQGDHDAAVRHADASMAAFGRLDPGPASSHAGFIAEAWRIAGVTRMGSARNAEALRLIEQAVMIAEEGVRNGGDACLGETTICASTALIRGGATLGSMLLTARDLGGALEVLHGAVATIDAAPEKAALVPEDVMLVFSTICETLHRLVREERASNEAEQASRHLEEARLILDARLRPMVLADEGRPGRSLGIYWEEMGENLLLRGDAAAALACFLRARGILLDHGVARLDAGTASTGIARACLALGQIAQALVHARQAADEIGREHPYYRSVALLVLSRAWQEVGDFRQALECLEQFNTLRDQLEAASARQYAARITARIGLERAVAEAEAERRHAATLETLGQIGQQIIAKLTIEEIFETLRRHVGSLLDAPGFAAWMMDETSRCLRLAFAIGGGAVFKAEIALDDPSSGAARVIRERREIVIEAEPGEPDGAFLHEAGRLRSLLFAPLLVAERQMGVLSVQSDRPRAYDGTARWILRTLCAYAAIALDNAAAHQQLSTTLAQLHASQAQLAHRTEELERLSTIDPLTGVGNRRHLASKAEAEIAAAQRYSRPLGVVLFDIDHFKTINDRFGHAAGDEVLKDVAGLVQRMLRPSDVLARQGGEEFAILLPDSDRAETAAVAGRIRAAFEAMAFRTGGTGFTVTASFGTSRLEPGEPSISAALSRADKALYQAKQAGRNRVVSM